LCIQRAVAYDIDITVAGQGNIDVKRRFEIMHKVKPFMELGESDAADSSTSTVFWLGSG